MALVNKSHYCPYLQGEHYNLAYCEYDNGHWCYSCNKGKFFGDDKFPLLNRADTKDMQSLVNLPRNTVFDPKKFSPSVLEWLYSHFVYEAIIRRHGIGYIEYDDFTTHSGLNFKGESLVFPVLDEEGKMNAYQRRFFPDKQMLSKEVQKHSFFVNNKSNKIVLVEDYISAIRVGEAKQYDTLCLFGTSLKQEVMLALLDKYAIIYLWLDGDEPGQNSAKKIKYKIEKELTNIREKYPLKNITVTNLINVKSEKDPKTYTNQEILNILEGCSETILK